MLLEAIVAGVMSCYYFGVLEDEETLIKPPKEKERAIARSPNLQNVRQPLHICDCCCCFCYHHHHGWASYTNF